MIVGSGIGGAAAAWDAVRFIPDAKVTLIGDEELYVRHKIRYLIRGLDISLDMGFLETGGVATVRDTATRVNRNAKLVQLKDGEMIPYDYLVLATGANPTRPPVPGGELALGFRRKGDVRVLMDEKPSNVAIAGASYVAMHAAQVCTELGSEPCIVVRSRLIRKSLEPELSAELESKLKERGVKFVHGKLKKIEKDGLLTDERRVEADLTMTALGVTPNSQLGKEAGLELWWDNIRVDKQGGTSDPSIFAIGDVSNCYDPITGEISYFGLATVATIMALNAVRAIAGSKAALRTPRYIKDVFFGDIYVKSMGFTKPEAEKAGMSVERTEVTGNGNGRGYLVYRSDDRRLVGYNAIASEDAGFDSLEVLNAILRRKKVDDILGKLFTPVERGG